MIGAPFPKWRSFAKMVPAKPDKAFLSKIKTKMTERKRKLAEECRIGDGGGTHMVSAHR